MPKNNCVPCGGTGLVVDPNARWWRLFTQSAGMMPCEACGGDGYAKPPGWPDRIAMSQLSPPPPPAKSFTLPASPLKTPNHETWNLPMTLLRATIFNNRGGRYEAHAFLSRDVAGGRERQIGRLDLQGSCATLAEAKAMVAAAAAELNARVVTLDWSERTYGDVFPGEERFVIKQVHHLI